MKIIGITGQSGSGKGMLSKSFAKLGYVHADADKIYHGLLDTNKQLFGELVSAFGDDITRDGKIDRKALGKKVLGKENARKLLRLNKIAHKYVCREYIKLILTLKEQNAKGLIIDAPLLIEARLNVLCDTNIFVACSKETQIERIMARDSISRDAAILRLASQKPLEFYAKHCEHFFLNDNSSIEDLDAFAKQIDSILNSEDKT